MSEDELLTSEADLNQLSSTVIELLHLKRNSLLPPPIKIFNNSRCEQLIAVLLDNFGLFECVYYKPRFLITKVKALVLLNCHDPFTAGFISTLVYAGGNIPGFNLIKFLIDSGLKTRVIGDAEDASVFRETPNVTVTANDTETYVQAIKALNRFNFLWLHFLDFEKLYSEYKFQPPITIAQKLITRTDSWILTLYKQLKPNSLVLILGTHGKRMLDMGYQAHFRELRGASVPIAVFIEK